MDSRDYRSVFALAPGMKVELPNPVSLKLSSNAGKHHLVLSLADQRDCFRPARVWLVHARTPASLPKNQPS